MTGPKIVIVVLVVVTVLFFVGLGMGLSGEGSGPANVDWIEAISGALAPRFDFDKVESTCIDRTAKAFIVERQATCQAKIPAASGGTRRIALTLKEGGGVETRYQAPPDHEKIDEEDQSADQALKLEPEKSSAVVVLEEGGTLTLTCTAPEKARCRIEVK